jgi:hypothetical protein
VALDRALLASLAISDLPRAVSALTRINSHLDGLTPHQIGRLAAIDRVLDNPGPN